MNQGTPSTPLWSVCSWKALRRKLWRLCLAPINYTRSMRTHWRWAPWCFLKLAAALRLRNEVLQSYLFGFVFCNCVCPLAWINAAAAAADAAAAAATITASVRSFSSACYRTVLVQGLSDDWPGLLISCLHCRAQTKCLTQPQRLRLKNSKDTGWVWANTSAGTRLRIAAFS